MSVHVWVKVSQGRSSMEFEVYKEEDDVLRARARLALHKTYSLAEAVTLVNRLNVFDTLDGYRIVLIKERDPLVFGFDYPVMHVSVRSTDPKAIIPKMEPGWVGLAARLLVRLGLPDCAEKVLQTQAKGTAVHVWFMVEEWVGQSTQPQVAESA